MNLPEEVFQQPTSINLLLGKYIQWKMVQGIKSCFVVRIFGVWSIRFWYNMSTRLMQACLTWCKAPASVAWAQNTGARPYFEHVLQPFRKRIHTLAHAYPAPGQMIHLHLCQTQSWMLSYPRYGNSTLLSDIRVTWVRPLFPSQTHHTCRRATLPKYFSFGRYYCKTGDFTCLYLKTLSGNGMYNYYQPT